MRDFIVSLCVFLAFLLLILGLTAVDNGGYKRGQIDALTGNILYELQAQPDSTVIWVKIEGEGKK